MTDETQQSKDFPTIQDPSNSQIQLVCLSPEITPTLTLPLQHSLYEKKCIFCWCYRLLISSRSCVFWIVSVSVCSGFWGMKSWFPVQNNLTAAQGVRHLLDIIVIGIPLWIRPFVTHPCKVTWLLDLADKPGEGLLWQRVNPVLARHFVIKDQQENHLQVLGISRILLP